MKIPAVLVATANSLRSSGGGVQLCTNDYLLLLREAGFDLHEVAFEPDRRFAIRVLRRVEQRPFRRMVPPTLMPRVVAAIERVRAEFVFLNLIDFPTLLPPLRSRFAQSVKFVHLSHGLDSTDLCITQQIQRVREGVNEHDRSAACQLGAKLQCEADYRRQLDASLCLSPLDAELERWLGVPRTAWFPRTIREDGLNHRPIKGWVGCVATLNHVPNHQGLLESFVALARLKLPELKFRLVGGPALQGREFAKQFDFVEYLGPLSAEQLRAEASRWSCFVHPIFHYARGCSTKLAVALGWGLPLATTVDGVRGYVWDDGILPVAATPQELAACVSDRIADGRFDEGRERTSHLASLQPSASEIARRMGEFLRGIGRAGRS